MDDDFESEHTGEDTLFSGASYSSLEGDGGSDTPESYPQGKSPTVVDDSEPSSLESNDTANESAESTGRSEQACERPRSLPDDVTGARYAYEARSPYRQNHPAEYSSWSNLVQRCRKRGYVLHPAYKTFPGFYGHLGPKPARDYSVDRIDPDNPEYGPANCRWASPALQTANRRNTRFLTDSQGQRYSAAEWSRRTGVSRTTILRRVDDLGWSVDDAVSTPAGSRRRYSSDGPAGPVPSERLIAVWRRVLREAHGQDFFSATKREAGMLRQATARLARDIHVDPLHLMEEVLTHWTLFTEYAEDMYGAYNSPAVPTPEYLLRWVNAAANWWVRHSEDHGLLDMDEPVSDHYEIGPRDGDDPDE